MNQTQMTQSGRSLTEFLRNPPQQERTPTLIHSMQLSWLLDICRQAGNTPPKFNGIKIEKVKVCGVINLVSSERTKVVVQIDDDSGSINISTNKTFNQALPDVFGDLPVDL